MTSNPKAPMSKYCKKENKTILGQMQRIKWNLSMLKNGIKRLKEKKRSERCLIIHPSIVLVTVLNELEKLTRDYEQQARIRIDQEKSRRNNF